MTAPSAGACLALLFTAAGCLPGSEPINGRQLFSGRDVEGMRFATIAGRSFVSFEVRKQRRTPEQPGIVEWRMAAWDDGAPLVVVPDRSDAWGVSSQDLDPANPEGDYENRLETSDRLYYVMRDERPADPATGVNRTGTLTLLTVTGGIREQIPSVASFAVSWKPGVFYYRRPATDRPTPDLILRDDQGRQRVLQDVTGPASFYGAGDGLEFVGGADRTLYRMRSIDAPIEPLRAGVGRHLNVDANRYLMTVPDKGKPVTTLFTVPSRRERELPGESICCWLGVRQGRFWYAEAATADRPGRLHFYHLDTAEDLVLTLPRGLADVTGLIDRPGSATQLLLDSAGKMAVLDLAADPPIRPLQLTPIAPRFTPDGQYLLYLDPERLVPEPEGRLMVTDLINPPRQLSPLGALVQADSYFLMNDDNAARVVFWARYGRTVSDLYFTTPEGGEPKLIAEQIRDVSVGFQSLLGIVNASLQDLTGDLIRKDLMTGDVRLYSHAVESFDSDRERLAFYIWNRVPAAQDGIWAATP